MTLSSTIESPSNRTLDGPTDWPDISKIHGFMAPGVKAFRRIAFPAKSAWVSVAFLFPIFLLSASLWLTSKTNIEFSSKERLGVEYTRAIMPLLDAAQNRRRAAVAVAADLPEASDRVTKAFEAVVAAHNKNRHEIPEAESWAKLQRAHQELSSRVVLADRTATFDAHTAYIETVFELLRDVGDSSNLTLDPDVDTFYLMDSGLVRQPLLIEQMGRIRGLGSAVLTSGTKTRQQHDVLTNSLAFALAYKQGSQESLNRAIAADPSLKNELSEDEVLRATQTYLDLVRSSLLGDALGSDPKTFLAAANAAIEQNYKSIEGVTNALDKRLDARVAKLNATLYVQLGVSLLGVAVAVYMLVAFYRVTQGGISEVARQLDEIAKGNLTLNPRPGVATRLHS